MFSAGQTLRVIQHTVRADSAVAGKWPLGHLSMHGHCRTLLPVLMAPSFVLPMGSGLLLYREPSCCLLLVLLLLLPLIPLLLPLVRGLLGDARPPDVPACADLLLAFR